MIILQMKSFLAIAILISFISISVLGFIGLSQMHKAMGSNCSADTTQGMPCPIKDGIFAFAAFHLKGLQELSQAGFVNVSPLFLLAIILLAFSMALVFSGGGTERVPSQTYFKKNYEDKVRDVGFKMISWLAYLENSPSFIKGA